ncbi:MAG: hypothetical protein OEM52_06580 [bacterium]|nr:hypothetical protein [bacterium]
MPWGAQYNSVLKCVELNYIGQVSAKDLFDAFIVAGNLAQENNTIKFLADCTLLTGGHTLADVFTLISNYSAGGVHVRFREAILLPKQEAAVQEVAFYETACLNRGFDVKVFTNRAEAEAWLVK